MERRNGWVLVALLILIAGSAQAEMVTGSYVGDGAGTHEITGLGFEPMVVIVKADGGDSAVMRTDTMPLNWSRHLVEEWGLNPDRILDLTSDGFLLGSDDDVNRAGRTYWYIAFSDDPGYLATGGFTGNGAASRTISGLGFEPGMVLLIPHDLPRCRLRTASMPGTTSVPLGTETETHDDITALTADGFDVGSNHSNIPGVNYSYWAMAGEATSAQFGTYTGDGANGRAIAGVGFQPRWVLTKQFGNKLGAHLTQELSGLDKTLTFTADNTFSGGIQSLEADGFIIDNQNRVNENGQGYHYAAFADRVLASADLSVNVMLDDTTPALGDIVTFTATVANTGPTAATGATLHVDLPAGLTQQSYTADADATADNSDATAIDVVWDLPAGQSRQVVATYRVDLGAAARDFVGHVSSSTPDPAPANDDLTATMTVTTVDVSVAMASSNTAPPAGGTVTATYDVVNPSATTAVEITADLTIPVGMTDGTATPSHGTYDAGLDRWAIGTLPAGATATLTLDIDVATDQGGNTLTPAISVNHDHNDTDLANNTADLDHVISDGIDVAVTAGFDPATATAGETVDLTMTLTNNGPGVVNSFDATVTLPAGLTYQSHVEDRGTYDDGTGQWTGPAMPDGNTTILTITALVTAGSPGTLQAGITAAAVVADPIPANNTAIADLDVTGGYDVVPSISWSPAATTAGDTVDLEVSIANQGPGDAPGFTATVTLPTGFTYGSHTVSDGSYDSGTGVWTFAGPMAVPGTESLTISVLTPTDGVGTSTASVDLALQPGELAPGNDSQSADIDLTAVTDLALATVFAPASSEVGDTSELQLTVTNNGPGPAGGFTGAVVLPAGLQYQSHVAGSGAYDSGTGAWILAAPLASGATADLAVTVLVTDPDAASLTANASVTAVDSDPVPANNAAEATLALTAVTDLALQAALTPDTAWPGIPAALTYTVTNNGPAAVDTCSVSVTLPADLGATRTDGGPGAWTAGTGQWLLPDGLAVGESAVLVLALDPDTDADTDFTVDATVAPAAGNDPVPVNDATSVTVFLGRLADLVVRTLPMDAENRTLMPGGPMEDVLRLRIVNSGGLPATLSSLTMHNPAQGTDQATHDGYWSALSLRSEGNLRVDLPGFVDGSVTAVGLDLTVAADDSVDLVLRGGVAIAVPDGVALQPEVNGAEDFGFDGAPAPSGDWPLVAEGSLFVNGMTAAQITLHPVGAEIFQMGSVRNEALDFVVPGNGGTDDVMTKLNVVNLGTAVPVSMITSVEAWADDGDGILNPAVDTWITELYWTGGQRFEASALDVDVPAAGRRIIVSVDVAEDALVGTVQLSLPAGDDPAIGMLSGNDGPIDTSVDNPMEQTISSTDKVILTAATLPVQTVAPGDTHVPLLTLVARNLYADTHVLERLRVHNHTEGTGSPSQAELDGVTGQVRLHRDTNGNGQFDGAAVDSVMVSSTWDDGVATFDGVNWNLVHDQVTTLFVTASVSLTGAAEGDLLSARIGSSDDLNFDVDVAMVAAWPLDSDARHPVNGMVAAQIACPAVPPVSLTASEGPVLALDLTLPGNGYLGDALDDLRLDNLGNATPTDIADLGLWTDNDGNGVFEPGLDVRVATFTGVDGSWVALDLDLDLPAGGQRLFAGLTVTDTPTDSSTVRLAVATDGVTVDSENDGPLDGPVASPTSLLISTAPLLSSMEFTTARSTTDMTVTVTMSVTNVGSEAVNTIEPDPLTITGDGSLTPVSGPVPASMNLAADGASGTFTWTYASDGAGLGFATGRCEGVSAVGGQPRGSLATASAPHEVLDPATDLQLYPVVNMPFSINRGQQGVVPLTLTLLNDGGPERAEIALRELIVTLDDGDGGPVVPAHLLSRVTVGEGVNIYADISDLETSGQTITLPLNPEVVVTATEPVSLSLVLDIDTETDVERFRLSLVSADDLDAVDHVSDTARGVTLTDASFPVRSAAGSIVSQATGLLVSGVPMDDHTAGAGQDDVPLLQLSLSAVGDGAGSEVKVGGFAVSITDTNGVRLAQPQDHLARIRVEGPLAVHDEHLLEGAADSLIVFELSPQITVPVGEATVALQIHGRLPDDPELGPLVLHLEPAEFFDARDGNVSSAVGVTYTPVEIDGPRVTIQEPAPSLLATAIGHLPPALPQNAQDVAALSLQLEHPGPLGTAAVRLDTLRLHCLDAERDPQDPDAILDGYVVTWNGTMIDAPVIYEDHQVAVPLGGRLLMPATTSILAVAIDIEADAPAVGLELVLEADGLVASDANLLTAVSMQPAPGAVLPGSSGLTSIQPASDEVLVAWTDVLPPLLATNGAPVEAARITLHNPADPGAAPAQLGTLVLRTASAENSDLATGEVLEGARITVDGVDWAGVDGLATTDSTAQLTGAEPLVIAGGATIELSIQVVPRTGGAPPGARFGLRSGDLDCTQADGTTPVPVRASDGNTLPFWTEASSLAAADLAASYINFPNPFAAGREATHFAFQLPQAATVTLRLWTPRGESVITVLDDEALASGLHQDLDWDGRNGRGTVVRNGVYLAELKVRYDDGSSERLLRKVAVVR